MKVFFRTDSSAEIGSGHVMRCLTLADELSSRGADIAFVCRAHPDGLSAWIRERKGFPVIDLPLDAAFGFRRKEGDAPYAHWLHEDPIRDAELTYDAVMTRGGADWMVTDHYALDAFWESRVKTCVKKTLVIDDLADRRHVADALLDQNYFKKPGSRYDGLIDKACVRFLGPRYALLRKEFAAMPARPVLERVRDVLVFFGAGDPAALVPRALRVLRPLAAEYGFTTHALVGALSPYRDAAVEAARDFPGCHVYEGFTDIAGLLRAADLFIGAGGTVTWERAACGVPAVIISAAANQNPFSEDLAVDGMQSYLGPAGSVSDDEFKHAVKSLLDDAVLRRRFSEASRKLVDGLGAVRVADVLFGTGGDL